MGKDKNGPQKSADPRQQTENLMQRMSTSRMSTSRMSTSRMSTSRQFPEPDDLSSGDAQRLIQDLRTRQAELERQNEVLTTSRDRYFTLYDEAPVAYVVVSDEGLIVEANHANAALLGTERSVLIDTPLTDFIAPEEHDGFHARHREAADNAIPMAHRASAETGIRQVCEMRMVRADGTPFPARLEYVSAADERGAMQCRIVISDITERTQAAQKARTRTEGLAAVSELAIELAAAPPDADISELIAKRLRSITGAIATSVSAYDPERRELSVQYIASPAGIISRTNSLLGRDLIGMRMPVSPQMLERMLTEMVAIAEDLSEATFGTVPKPVAVVIQKVLGLGDFVGLSLQYGDQLAGTAMTVMPKGQSPPPPDVMEALAHVAAVSLRRKRAEQALAEQTRALQESEEQYRRLVESSDDLIFSVDRAGTFRTAGGARLHAFGLAPKDVVGHSLEELFGEEAQRYQERHRQVFETGKPMTYEHSFEFAGVTRTEMTTLYPIIDERGEVELVGVIWRDITERVRIEAIREHTEEALRESEEQYRGLFEGMPVGLYRTTPEGRILSANPALVEMLGYPDEETLLATDAADIYAEPEEREREQALLESDGLVRHFETQLRRRDGAVIWVRDTARAVRDTKGHMPYYEGSIEDITQRKHLEEQIQQQQRLAAVGQLAGGIAHDFNNLLTSIMLNADILLRKPRLPAEVTQGLGTILKESQRAAQLVQQILDFSRRSMLDRRPIDLISPVEEAAGILQRTLPETIHLRIQAKAGTCIVNADPARIQQALMNLALNARDAMPEGGELCIGTQRIEVGPGEPPPLPVMERHQNGVVQEGVERHSKMTVESQSSKSEIENRKPEVETDVTVADEYIADEYIADEYIRDSGRRPHRAWACLSVSDTGSGMSEEVQTHLFEPFFTTKPVGQGTGLGLAQVYGIVKQHGGYIDWETESGRGTTFRIYLPICEIEKPEKATEEETFVPVGKGETILLVEDSERIREAGLRTLEPLGYRILTAADGREALAVYGAEERVDLVVTDMVMPTMGGRELMRKLRETNPEIKGLVITGYALKEDLHELRREGIVGVVHKPFELETLARAIRRALDDSTRHL